MNKKTLLTLLFVIGLLLVAAGTVMPLFTGLQSSLFRYIYATGAALTLVSRLFSRYEGNSLRLKRLHRMELWSAILYCAGAFFLFYAHGTFQEALAFTLAGAAMQIYVSVMAPIAEKKEKE